MIGTLKYAAEEPISLSMVNLNYDSIVDIIDSKIFYNSLYNGQTLSNLQEYLAKNMKELYPIHIAIT